MSTVVNTRSASPRTPPFSGRTKFGCGAALCGACTVHLDGQANCHSHSSFRRDRFRAGTDARCAELVGKLSEYSCHWRPVKYFGREWPLSRKSNAPSVSENCQVELVLRLSDSVAQRYRVRSAGACLTKRTAPVHPVVRVAVVCPCPVPWQNGIDQLDDIVRH